MKRTSKQTKPHTTRRQKQLKAFASNNRRLFFFLALLVGGAVLGVVFYRPLTDAASLPWESLFALPPVEAGFAGGWEAFRRICGEGLLWLTGFFLLGLWACGVPFLPLGVLLYGGGLGLTEAYYYTQGWRGVFVVAGAVLPEKLLMGAVLLAAASEGMRCSLRLTGKLTAEGSADTSASFRLYCLRFLLFAVGIGGIGLLGVVLRTAFGGLLS